MDLRIRPQNIASVNLKVFVTPRSEGDELHGIVQFGGARHLTSTLVRPHPPEAEPRRVNANWTAAGFYLDFGGATDKALEETGPVAS